MASARSTTSAPTRPARQTAARAERRADDVLADRAIERAVLLVFAPLHKRVFGMAVGGAAAVFLVLVSVADLALDPAHRFPLELLAVYFRGYDLSPQGIAVGAAWAAFVGFVAGWFSAFCRNLVFATWLIYVRARAALVGTRDFLDHI